MALDGGVLVVRILSTLDTYVQIALVFLHCMKFQAFFCSSVILHVLVLLLCRVHLNGICLVKFIGLASIVIATVLFPPPPSMSC